MKNKKPLKVIFSVIGISFVTLLVIVVCYILFMSISGKIPKIFGYGCLNIVSNSMEPAIPTNTYILIEDVPHEELVVGDVITFYSKNQQIYNMPNTHRIVEIKDENGSLNFVTKGDANNTHDNEIVAADTIIGKYVSSIPFLTKIQGLWSNPIVFFIIIVIPAAVLFVIEIRHLIKTAKEKPEEDENAKED